VYGLTVVVVDGEEQSRTRLLLCLRRLGLRALGVDTTADAVALLEEAGWITGGEGYALRGTLFEGIASGVASGEIRVKVD